MPSPLKYTTIALDGQAGKWASILLDGNVGWENRDCVFQKQRKDFLP